MSITIKSTVFFFSLLSLHLNTSSPAFLAPITKDFSTRKYLLQIYLNTPPRLTNLLLDLGASSTLVECLHSYRTSTSTACDSSSCGACSSSNGTCSTLLRNSPTVKRPSTGRPVTGSLSMPVTDGANPGQLGSVPGFTFSCNRRSSIKGLVKGASGLAGLGRSNLSIPAQVSNYSSENRAFALCLSGSPSAPGVAFFGSSGPYHFLPEVDLAKHLSYTPLLSSLSSSDEYFIGLTSMRVNGKDVDFDRTVLSIDDEGRGGTKLSTVAPYTVLRTSIFEELTQAFVNALNLTATTKPVEPFRVCYSADAITSSHVGPAVPTVDFVLGDDDDVVWRNFGSNSMVRVYRDDGGVDVWCLGFVDGGARPRTSVVIGGHQMEDNLLQFDLEAERVGFSSSVLVHGTMCGNFNFTTNGNLRS